jgi:hypothetical protein
MIGILAVAAFAARAEGRLAATIAAQRGHQFRGKFWQLLFSAICPTKLD